MASPTETPSDRLAYANRLRARTRLARSGPWLPLVVFAIAVLGSMPFYLQPTFSAAAAGCRREGAHLVVCTQSLSGRFPLGGGLGSPFAGTGLNRWETVYWTIALVVGLAAVALACWRRSRANGVSNRVWPLVAIGAGLLVAAIASGGWAAAPELPDFWMRGTQALLVIAAAILVQAFVERDRLLVCFAVGFLGLALLSCLYDEVNILQRVGLGAAFNGSTNALPNLLLPGLYLLIGGAAFWLRRRRASRAT